MPTSIDFDELTGAPEVNAQSQAFLSQPDPPVPKPFSLSFVEIAQMPQEKANIKTLLMPAFEWAEKSGPYGQLRWHIMSAGSGQQTTNQATKDAAFEKLYAKCPHPHCYTQPKFLPRTAAERQMFIDEGRRLRGEEEQGE